MDTDHKSGNSQAERESASQEPSHFFAHLFRMKLINRWPLMRNINTETINAAICPEAKRLQEIELYFSVIPIEIWLFNCK